MSARGRDDVPAPGELRHTTRGAAAVLERMSVDEWDALRAGEISADDLREKYLGDGDPEQADLGGWSK